MVKFAGGIAAFAVLLAGIVFYLSIRHADVSATNTAVETLALNRNILQKQKSVPTEATTSKQVSVVDLKPGDLSGSMRVVSVAPLSERFGGLQTDNAQVVFSGTAEVEGKYKYDFSDFDGDWVLNFTPDISNTQLPQVKERSSIFIFTNNEDALALLKISKDKPSSGKAHITVEGYILNSLPAEVHDRSKILFVK